MEREADQNLGTFSYLIKDLKTCNSPKAFLPSKLGCDRVEGCVQDKHLKWNCSMLDTCRENVSKVRLIFKLTNTWVGLIFET